MVISIKKLLAGILAVSICIFTISFLIRVSSVNLKNAISSLDKDKEDFVIILDPGHGGKDAGASSGNVYEKDLNLDVALKLKQLLNVAGYNVVLTRQTDDSTDSSDRFNKREDLQNRIDTINKYENAVLLSIHMNKYDGGSVVKGAQMFYRSKCEVSMQMASYIMEDFRALQTDNKRQIKPIPDVLYMFKRTKVPCVLIECGFLSNTEDLENLKTDEYRSKTAVTIFTGVMRYLSELEKTDTTEENKWQRMLKEKVFMFAVSADMKRQNGQVGVLPVKSGIPLRKK